MPRRWGWPVRPGASYAERSAGAAAPAGGALAGGWGGRPAGGAAGGGRARATGGELRGARRGGGGAGGERVVDPRLDAPRQHLREPARPALQLLPPNLRQAVELIVVRDFAL